MRFPSILFVLLLSALVGGPARAGDHMSWAAVTARSYSHLAGPVAWQAPAPYESADLVQPVARHRLLVGSLTTGERHGVPRHDSLYLLDSRTGEVLWTAPRPPRPEGEYRVVATAPHLVLTGYEGNQLELIALDLETGKRRWRAKQGYPATVRVLEDALLVLSHPDRVLQALNPRTGAQLWSRKLEGARVPELLVVDSTAVLLGESAVGISTLTGAPRWTLRHLSFAAPTAGIALGRDALLWNAHTLLRVETLRGRIRWETPAGEGGLKGVYAAGDRVLRLAGGEEGERVQALDAGTGGVAWTRATTTAVVSPVVRAGETAVFTQDASVVGLALDDGAPRFETAMPANFSWGSPARQPLLGLPDRVLVLEGGVVVYRERVGLLALDPADGKVRWVQEHWDEVHDYTAGSGMYELTKYAEVSETAKGTGGLVHFERTGPNPFLEAAQVHQRETYARTGRVLANRQSTRMARRGAHQARELSSREVAVHQRIDMAFGRAQAMAGFTDALMGLGDAIRQQRIQRAIQGAVQRSQMQGRAMLRLQGRVLQDGYLVEPANMGIAGRGITMIDLDTGRRADWLCQPLTGPLSEFAVDGLAVHYDPEAERVYAFGVGMDPDAWEVRRKYRATFPRPSILAFDVSRIDFGREKAKLQP